MSLYRFKSRETADLVMLEPDGRRILEALWKNVASGIIQPAEMAAAAITLRDATQADEQLQEDLRRAAELAGDPEPTFEPVSFRQRSAPLLDMMRRCGEANVEIIWGV